MDSAPSLQSREAEFQRRQLDGELLGADTVAEVDLGARRDPSGSLTTRGPWQPLVLGGFWLPPRTASAVHTPSMCLCGPVLGEGGPKRALQPGLQAGIWTYLVPNDWGMSLP